MTLRQGTRLGPYEIVAPLASGGMGDVYRARDDRIGREVAIKVLPERVADDPDRIARFEREAKTAGSLSHPNLLVLHDLGRHEGRPYLVTELLEGETLRERLDRGPMPWRRAVEVAAEIARGLAAAHRAGVVHRDLKPANLFVTEDGQVKILDFGLAKLAPSPTIGLPEDEAETETFRAVTEPGTVLGTVGYMAPEQVRGEVADQRSDLFAVGAVLFELLTGRRAFPGGDPISISSAILEREPDESTLPAELPAELVATVRRCLEKSPDRRFQSADDLAFHLETLVSGSGQRRHLSEGPTPTWLVFSWRRLGTAGGLLGLGLLLGLVFPRGDPISPTPAEPPPALMPLTASGTDRSPAVSPDGSTIAFVSSRDGRDRIWIARTDGSAEVPLTEGPADRDPRFSPDGDQILFLREGALFRVPTLGGQARRIADDATLADWSRTAGIFFARPSEVPGRSELVRIDADGSDPRVIHSLEDRLYASARSSPDGRRLAFVPQSPGSNVLVPEIVVLDLETGEERRFEVLPGGTTFSAAWAPDGGLLVYTQSEARSPLAGRYRLVTLDPATGEQRVIFRHPQWLGVVDVDADGRIHIGARVARAALVELELGTSPPRRRTLSRGAAFDRQPIYSPDGDRIVFSSSRGGNVDLWSMDVATREVHRLTDDPGADWDPGFMPDGRLLWTSDRSGNFEIWIAEPDGSHPRQVTQDGFDAENPSSTPGGWIVYNSGHPDKTGVWHIRPDGNRAERLAAGLTALPQASPVAELAVYLRPVPPASARLEVIGVEDAKRRPFETTFSAGTGSPITLVPGRSRWLPDGSGIVSVGRRPDGRSGLLVTPYRPGGGDPPASRPLFEQSPGMVESFGIAPDGSRLVASVLDFIETVSVVEGLALGASPGEASAPDGPE